MIEDFILKFKTTYLETIKMCVNSDRIEEKGTICIL